MTNTIEAQDRGIATKQDYHFSPLWMAELFNRKSCFYRKIKAISEAEECATRNELRPKFFSFRWISWIPKRCFGLLFEKLEDFNKSCPTDADKTKPKVRRKAVASNLHTFLLFVTCFCAITSVRAYEREGNPPRIVTSDVTTLSAYKGQTLTLPCMVSGNPFPLTIWWKDGLQISREWKRFKQQRTSLRIRNVELSDSGLYHCEAVNGYGTRQVEIQLQVHEESRSQRLGRKRDTVKPMFSQPIKMRRHNIVKPLGGAVSFKCKARGKPRPRIQWYKDGNLTEIPNSNGNTKARWILTLHNIKSHDSGRYTCRVWNSVGEITFDYTLRVVGISRHERPVLLKPHPLNTTITAGEKASVQCRVRSVIPPTVKWIKRLDRESLDSFEGKLPNNSLEINKKLYLILPPQEMMRLPDGSYLNKLVIGRAKESDSGMYICLGANTMGYNFRYAYLTVSPAGKNGIISSRKVTKQSPSHAIIIGLPAGLALVLVCIVTAYCFHKRDRGLFSRKSETAHNQQLSNQTTPCFEEVTPLPTTSSRLDETVATHPDQHLLNVQYVPKITVKNLSHITAFTPLDWDKNSTSNSNKISLSEKNFPEQSESEVASNYVHSPPPPPPSQYSRSSSTDAGSRYINHHSCNQNRHHYHHHHHRCRTPPNSLSSHSYCSYHHRC